MVIFLTYGGVTLKKYHIVHTFLSMTFLSSCIAFPNPQNPCNPHASINVSGFSCKLYGPFVAEDGTITVSCSYMSTNDNTYETCKIKTLDTLEPLMSKNANKRTYNKLTGIVKFECDIPFDEILVPQGIVLEFYVKDSTSKETIFCESASLKPKSPLTMSSKGHSTYEIKDTMFIFPVDADKTTEKFSFTETVETFQNEDYFILPLDDIFFNYNLLDSKFSYSSSYLTCVDTHGFFKNCYKDEKVKIPLKCIENISKNRISFEYKEKMFVDPTSLLMSNTALYGYQETYSFYLPRNKGNEMDESSFEIVVEGAGKNKSHISIPLTYYSARNHFGNCDDSDYCVVGELIK